VPEVGLIVIMETTRAELAGWDEEMQQVVDRRYRFLEAVSGI